MELDFGILSMKCFILSAFGDLGLRYLARDVFAPGKFIACEKL
jgi:hypothetical protein